MPKMEKILQFSKETVMPVGFVILLIGAIVSFNDNITRNDLVSNNNAREIIKLQSLYEKIDDRQREFEQDYNETLLNIYTSLEAIKGAIGIQQATSQ